jgi:hypothetical protein
MDFLDFRPQRVEVVTNTLGTKADPIGYGVRISVTSLTDSHEIPSGKLRVVRQAHCLMWRAILFLTPFLTFLYPDQESPR